MFVCICTSPHSVPLMCDAIGSEFLGSHVCDSSPIAFTLVYCTLSETDVAGQPFFEPPRDDGESPCRLSAALTKAQSLKFPSEAPSNVPLAELWAGLIPVSTGPSPQSWSFLLLLSHELHCMSSYSKGILKLYFLKPPIPYPIHIITR